MPARTPDTLPGVNPAAAAGELQPAKKRIDTFTDILDRTKGDTSAAITFLVPPALISSEKPVGIVEPGRTGKRRVPLSNGARLILAPRNNGEGGRGALQLPEEHNGRDRTYSTHSLEHTAVVKEGGIGPDAKVTVVGPAEEVIDNGLFTGNLRIPTIELTRDVAKPSEIVVPTQGNLIDDPDTGAPMPNPEVNGVVGTSLRLRQEKIKQEADQLAYGEMDLSRLDLEGQDRKTVIRIDTTEQDASGTTVFEASNK